MSLADELMKLEQLRGSGALSEEEFQTAKRRLLDAPAAAPAPAAPAPAAYAPQDSLGRAANRYVSFQMISAAVGLAIFLIFVCSMGGGRFLPF
jgi:hypothetical protein